MLRVVQTLHVNVNSYSRLSSWGRGKDAEYEVLPSGFVVAVEETSIVLDSGWVSVSDVEEEDDEEEGGEDVS